MNTYNIDEDIVILEKYRLTPTELFVLKTILLFDDDNSYLHRYLQIDSNKKSFRDMISSKIVETGNDKKSKVAGGRKSKEYMMKR